MYIPYTGNTFTVSNYNIYKLLSLYLPGTKSQKYFVYHIISTIFNSLLERYTMPSETCSHKRDYHRFLSYHRFHLAINEAYC